MHRKYLEGILSVSATYFILNALKNDFFFIYLWLEGFFFKWICEKCKYSQMLMVELMKWVV